MQKRECFCPEVVTKPVNPEAVPEPRLLFNGRLQPLNVRNVELTAVTETTTGTTILLSPVGLVCTPETLPQSVVAFFAGLWGIEKSPRAQVICAALGIATPSLAALYKKELTSPDSRFALLESLPDYTAHGELIVWGFKRFAVISTDPKTAQTLAKIGGALNPGKNTGLILSFYSDAYSVTIAKGALIGGGQFKTLAELEAYLRQTL